MAAQAELLRTQYITSIINKEFSGAAKFKGFQRSFESPMVRLHDNAGTVAHRVAMGDMKKELLIATLKDPARPPAKGMDRRKFVGAQS